MATDRAPRRRRGLVAAGVLLALGGAAEEALADARVGLGPPFVVQVIDKPGIDGGHQIVVEPFRDGGRPRAWRVRQLVFGQPPFSSIDPDCTVNGIVNDVVCAGAQTGATITMGDVRDVVRVRQVNKDVPGGTGASCVENPPLVVTRVLLGAGDDDVAYDDSGAPCASGQFALGHELPQRLDVSGGPGADTIAGGRFDDALRGDDQGDTISGGGGRDDVRGGDGGDTLNGGDDNDAIDGGAGADTVNGGAGADAIDGGGAGDVLNGGSGDDRFARDEGADVVDGGTGSDRMSYEAAGLPVFADLADDLANDGTIAIGPAVAEGDLLRNVEDVTGGGGQDTLLGNASANDLRGLGSADTLDGREGPDSLQGGDGPDVLRGGTGQDTLFPGFGADDIDGGPEQDTLSYASTDRTPVIVDLGARTGGHEGDPEARIANIEHVTGSLGPDTLTGAPGVSNVLSGFLGADTLTGTGLDTLLGGPGPDLLRGGGSLATDQDVLDGGDQDDRIEAKGGGTDAILCGPGTDTAIVDLQDVLGRFGEPGNCEIVEASPVDDGSPSRALGRVLRVTPAGRAAVRVRCPADARVDCAGVLSIRTADRRARMLGSRRYAVAVGATRTLRLALRGRLPRTVSVRTRERGASSIGLRRSVVLMRVTGGRRPPR